MRIFFIILIASVSLLCHPERSVAQSRDERSAAQSKGERSAAGAQPNGGRTLQIADMARIVNLEEPAIMPDGRTVALVTIREDLAAATDVDSLELVDLADGKTRTIVRGRDVAVPRWSPDGGRLAYLARANGVMQVYIHAHSGSARQITHAAADVIDVAWSPDGERLAYVASDVPPNRVALAQHHDYFIAGNNDYTATALTPSDHLWVVSLRDGHERRLTQGTWTIAPTDPGGIFSPQIAWTPDGRNITYTRVEDTFGGNNEYSTLWQIPATGGTAARLTTGFDRFELSPAYGPHADQLVYWYPRESNFLAENALHAFDGRRDVLLAPTLDRNIAGNLWYPGGRRILLCASDGTRVHAWNLDVRNGELRSFPLGDLNIVCDPYSSSTFDAGIAAGIDERGGVAFLATDARHARELYYLAPGASTPRRITHYNDFIASLSIGRMVNLDWTGPNGFAEDGVVTYPPNFDTIRTARPDEKFPVVLLIHGGPGLSSALAFVWEQWPLAQAIASHGYIVLQPNYRGSDNLGNAYMLAIVGDTADGPSKDVMAGLAALEKQPYVDSARVAVSGWSYGGLLTTWLIGHYHGWRASVSGAAVNDETEEYNLSISNVQNRYYLLASPYTGDGARIYAEQSPITYYKDITTPTLIWSTTLDPVVPIPQSYALYHALVDNHVPVRFVVFPGSTHGPSNPVQTADLTRFWLDWLDAHLHA